MDPFGRDDHLDASAAPPLSAQLLIAIGDELRLAQRVHRAVVIALHDRIDLQQTFDERVLDATDAIQSRIDELLAGDRPEVGTAADLRQHLAMLITYANHRAPDEYGMEQLRVARVDCKAIRDRHGQARAAYLGGWLRRWNGDSDGAAEELGNAGELEGSGFDFARGIIAVEAAFAALPSGDGNTALGDLEAVGASLERDGLPRELGYVCAAMAILAVDRGDFDEAAARLESARASFVESNYHGSESLDRLIDVVATEQRFALVERVRGNYRNAVAAAVRAVDAAQEIPAGWYLSQRKDDPFHEPFQRLYALAISLCTDVAGDADTARDCLRIVEMARRSNLAGMIRATVAERNAFTSIQRDAIRDGQLEEWVSMRPVLRSGRHDDGSAEVSAALGRELGPWLAEACFPESISADLIQQSLRLAKARGSDVLVVFEDPVRSEVSRGIAVYVPVDGSPQLTRIALSSRDRAFVDQLRKPMDEDFFALWPEHADALRNERGQTAAMSCLSHDDEIWDRLGEAILPPALTARLRDSLASGAPPRELLVSPTGVFAYLPWAALGLGKGARVVEAADVAIVPSLTLLQATQRERSVGAPQFAVGLTKYKHHLKWESIESTWGAAGIGARRISSKQDAIAFLRASASADGLYLLAHGSGDGGLTQCLVLGQDVGEQDLTAWEAFNYSWPRRVVLLSCHVGGTPVEAGIEPFAFSLACIASGADEFVAAIHEIIGYGNPVLHDALIEGLTGEVSTTRAIGDAQRRAFSEYRGQPIAYWAGLQVAVAC